jgi:hypothetical protein
VIYALSECSDAVVGRLGSYACGVHTVCRQWMCEFAVNSGQDCCQRTVQCKECFEWTKCIDSVNGPAAITANYVGNLQ